MKYFFYTLVVFLKCVFFAYAQQKTTMPIDSVYKEVDRAFELAKKSRYGEAIEISNSLLNYSRNTRDQRLKAKIYNVLGTAHFFAGNDSLSFDFLFKSKDLFIKIKDTSKIIIAYNNIGVNYRYLGNLDESNAYFKKSLELAEKGNSQKDLVHPLYNIGLNLISRNKDTLNDLTEGLMYLKRGEQLAEKFYEHKSIVAEFYETLSFVYNKLGDKEESQAYYDRTIAYANKHNYLDVLAEAHLQRAEIQADKSNFEQAYSTYKKYSLVKDSINSIKQFEKAKQVEANNFIKENKIKLKLIENEKAIQDSVIAKSRVFNIALMVFILMLLLFAFFVFKKNKELKLAKIRAERLSKVKSDFYSEISHELRTPLYAVIELSGLLLKENVNATHKEYLESLKFSGNHLMSLINNVLELNSVESGKMRLQISNFDLKNLISNIIDSLEYALRDSNNSISLKYDSTIPRPIVGDSLKLSQVLINLISNAIKFTNNGHIEIVINKVEDVNDNIKIYFKISDNGLGISLDKQSQIFEDFYQELDKNSKSYKGTGLGLAIVKRMLTAMGSDIQVISKENEGSTFWFELTFQKSTSDSLPNENYKNLLEELQDYTFLVVDDNKINLLVTRKVLDQLKIKSKTVDSGLKAIEIAKNENFDCILMDLHMPEMDGFETTKYIREFNLEVPIVALTAASTEEVENKINDYDIDAYVLKPFIINEFVETINRVIKNKPNTLT